MTLLRTLLICVLGLAIASDASAAKAKKKKNASSLEGVVTAIESGTDSVTLTVKASAAKKKKNAAPADANAPEKKVVVNKECKIEKVSGKKGQQETKVAAIGDIQKDSRVAIALKTGAATDTAEKVQILDQGKKKKKKANVN